MYGKREKRGGKWKKKGKIMQHCAKFRNSKNAKRREPTNTGWELGLKGTGSGRFKPPCPPPPPKSKEGGRCMGGERRGGGKQEK